MHLLVISHKKSPVHGHESFKIVPPLHLCVSFENNIFRNLQTVLIKIDEVTGIVHGSAFVYERNC